MPYAIHLAAAEGDVAAIKAILLGFPEQIAAPGPEGSSPLSCALRKKQRAAVEFLLESGAPAGARDIAEAARTGDSSLLELVLIHGEINRPDSRGMTPLQIECGRAGEYQSGSVRLLLAHGADSEPGNANDSPLLLAAKNANLPSENLKLLLEHGADPNSKDRTGCTPLFYVSQQGRADAVDVLLQYGGKVERSSPLSPVVPDVQDRRVTVLVVVLFVVAVAAFLSSYLR